MPNIDLAARSCTADFWTFTATFVDAYHVPETISGPFESILDLGANVGYTAADFAWRYPEARVLAVEMDPDNFRVLTENVAPFRERLDCINAAVWTHDQGVHYTTNVGAASYSAHETSSLDQGQRVASATIPQLLDSLPQGRAALVKMDVEGAEGILLAPEHSDWLARVDALTIEVHPPVSIDQLERWLAAAGFSVTKSRRHWSALEAVRDSTTHTRL